MSTLHQFSPARHSEGIPLVLQVSPLDAESTKQDKFYYDPFADLKFSNFVTARAFFIRHGHVVVFHECPNTMAYQEMFPMATIGYILALPPGLIAKGHEFFASQCGILRASAWAPPLLSGLPSSFWIVMWRRDLQALMAVPLLSRQPLSVCLHDRAFFVLLWYCVGGSATRLQSLLPLNATAFLPSSVRHLGALLDYHGGSQSRYEGYFSRYGWSGFPSSLRSGYYSGGHPFQRHGGSYGLAVPLFAFPSNFSPT